MNSFTPVDGRIRVGAARSEVFEFISDQTESLANRYLQWQIHQALDPVLEALEVVLSEWT